MTYAQALQEAKTAVPCRTHGNAKHELEWRIFQVLSDRGFTDEEAVDWIKERELTDSPRARLLSALRNRRHRQRKREERIFHKH